MTQVRTLKKGEVLCKEGDKIQNILVIQSGIVSVFLQRPKQRIELMQLGVHQLIGEQAFVGQGIHNVTCVALHETKVIEIPVASAHAAVIEANSTLRAICKGLNEKLKLLSSEVRSLKMERDTTPCPAAETAKAFGALFHTAQHKAQKGEGGKLTVNWPQMKQFAQRVFLENPKRLEQAVNLLVKLKKAELQMVKDELDPDGPDQLGFVHFLDLPAVEQFYEFYQFYYFKGGKTELLKVDESCAMVAAHLLEIAKNEPLDRHGAARMEYPKVVERFKTDIGLALKSDHFTLLESKGMMVKRQADDTGAVYISFDFKEWQRLLTNWRFLREIDKWNERGLVDPLEAEESLIKKQKAEAGGCQQCGTAFTEAQKFCANCGAKITAAA